jgi:hypothetical protein
MALPPLFAGALKPRLIRPLPGVTVWIPTKEVRPTYATGIRPEEINGKTRATAKQMKY